MVMEGRRKLGAGADAAIWEETETLVMPRDSEIAQVSGQAYAGILATTLLEDAFVSRDKRRRKVAHLKVGKVQHLLLRELRVPVETRLYLCTG